MPSFHSAQRTELLRRARQGDADALASLMATLRNYHRRLGAVQDDEDLRRKIDTSDVLQETEIQALKDFPTFEGEEIGQFVNWLRKILKTKRLKSARRFLTKKRDMKLEQELEAGLSQSTRALYALSQSDDLAPVDQVIQQEEALRLSDALDQLPEKQRKVVELYHLGGFTLREIGEQLGKSENAVQKLWTRALIKLGKLLKEEP